MDFEESVQQLIYKACHYKLTDKQIYLGVCGIVYDNSQETFGSVENYILDLVS